MPSRFESRVLRRLSRVQGTTRPNNEGKRSLVAVLFEHPVILAILGALLAATLVPFVASKIKITDQKALQELRVKVAEQILSDSAVVDERLTSLQFTLENFYNSARSNKNGYVDAQNELQREFNSQYAMFDQHAWHWFVRLPLQAKPCRLSAADQIKLIKLGRRYAENLMESVAALRKPRQLLLASDYRGVEPDTGQCVAKARSELFELQKRRFTVVSQMLDVFLS